MANDITTNEYQKYVALREQIVKGLEEADSEFMLTTYSMLHSVMNKRQKAAMQLNLRVENKAIREEGSQTGAAPQGCIDSAKWDATKDLIRQSKGTVKHRFEMLLEAV